MDRDPGAAVRCGRAMLPSSDPRYIEQLLARVQHLQADLNQAKAALQRSAGPLPPPEAARTDTDLDDGDDDGGGDLGRVKDLKRLYAAAKAATNLAVVASPTSRGRETSATTTAVASVRSSSRDTPPHRLHHHHHHNERPRSAQEGRALQDQQNQEDAAVTVHGVRSANPVLISTAASLTPQSNHHEGSSILTSKGEGGVGRQSHSAAIMSTYTDAAAAAASAASSRPAATRSSHVVSNNSNLPPSRHWTDHLVWTAASAKEHCSLPASWIPPHATTRAPATFPQTTRAPKAGPAAPYTDHQVIMHDRRYHHHHQKNTAGRATSVSVSPAGANNAQRTHNVNAEVKATAAADMPSLGDPYVFRKSSTTHVGSTQSAAARLAVAQQQQLLQHQRLHAQQQQDPESWMKQQRRQQEPRQQQQLVSSQMQQHQNGHTKISSDHEPTGNGNDGSSELVGKLMSAAGGKASPSLLKGRRCIIVANRLPVTIQRQVACTAQTSPSPPAQVTGDVRDGTVSYKLKKSAGGLVSAMAALEGMELVWIGWPGISVEEEAEQDIVRSKLADLPGPSLNPVFLPPHIQDLHYNKFSNDVLWPLLHYVPVSIQRISSATAAYKAYRKANHAFTLETMKHYRPGDLVWVQDYHLFLLPAMLRKLVPDVLCGIFLHTPFPSSEIVRVLPWREELLEGMLAADVVGFHTHDFARHFRSACQMILGHRLTAEGIDVGGHWFSSVGVFPIGIDPRRFKQTLVSDECRKHMLELEGQFHGKRVVLGVDRLDYIKGIPHKLLAFERFLEQNPDMRNQVVLVQIAVPSRTDVIEYQRLAKECHELVGRINGRFGSLSHTPIQFLDTSVAFPLLCALYSISACCFISSVRDGMNLVAYEFLTCQLGRPVEECGVLILSEFTGAAQSLGSGAIRINPWNIHEASVAIRYALTASASDRRAFRDYSWSYVREHTTQRWCEDFLTRLVTSSVSVGRIDNSVAQMPKLLNVSDAVSAFKSTPSSSHRLIVTTLTDTLTSLRSNTLGVTDTFGSNVISRANQVICGSINRLAADPNTTFVVVSSRSRLVCRRLLVNTGAWIAAENGYFLGIPSTGDSGVSGTEREEVADSVSGMRWEVLFDNVDLSWLAEAEKTMQHFCDRTPTTYLEINETSLIWHYANCEDKDFGDEQARMLVHDLLNGPLSTSTSVTHVQSRRLVCVRPAAVTQGFTLERILTRLIAKHGSVDFRLCVGSFFSHDEDVLSAIYRGGNAGGVGNGAAPAVDSPSSGVEDALAAGGGAVGRIDRLLLPHHRNNGFSAAAALSLFPKPYAFGHRQGDRNDDAAGDSKVGVSGNRDMQVFTCTVGKKLSRASYFVVNISAAQDLIISLASTLKSRQSRAQGFLPTQTDNKL